MIPLSIYAPSINQGCVMYEDLLAAIADSDQFKAEASLSRAFAAGAKALNIRDSLFPVVQRVLNKPFINPHLPKMYAINRYLLSYLDKEDIPDLVRLEVNEYARRAKLDEIAKPASLPAAGSFADIEEKIGCKDVRATASAMASFLDAEGPEKLSKRLLMLGSGYLDNSLGHSVSCTAFILLEMVERKDHDPWPVLVLLADYFCKGGFRKTPELKDTALNAYEDAYLDKVKRAVSGTGIVALHHTITLFAVEQSRQFFNNQEYEHMLTTWKDFLGSKPENLRAMGVAPGVRPEDYDGFFKGFAQIKTAPVVGAAMALASTAAGRRQLGRFLIKGVCQLYDGDYDPHFLTGLGAVLWVAERFSDQPAIIETALYQYVDYFFHGL